jgi:uncharacterized membrane protein
MPFDPLIAILVAFVALDALLVAILAGGAVVLLRGASPPATRHAAAPADELPPHPLLVP